jgi:hypothetical protein
MAHDYYAVLGLSPGCRDRGEIRRCFQVRRAYLLAQLENAARYEDTRRELDELYIAYAALQDAEPKNGDLQPGPADGDALGQLRGLIAASLEDGLLRYSRRQDILACGRALGLGDFQTHLLIAQVQFGDAEIPLSDRRRGAQPAASSRTWARLAGVGVLALTIFLFLVHWVSK